MASAVPKKKRKDSALAAANMAIPTRNSKEEAVRSIARTFFATSKTIQGRHLLRSERLATLLIDVLRANAQSNKFTVHDFVIMPDHFHLLLTIDNMMTVEKAMQLVKGGFSYRAKKELGHQGEIWQKGFSEVRIQDRPSFLQHRSYIEQNPVKAGLVDSPEKFPYGSAYLKSKKQASG
jgi:putative transposase